MKTTAEMIKVMQAFQDGKSIQVMERGDPTETWSNIIHGKPTWNWFTYDYRIKQPKIIKHSGWMNCYPDMFDNCIHKTKKLAEQAARASCIVTIPIEWEEPEQ